MGHHLLSLVSEKPQPEEALFALEKVLQRLEFGDSEFATDFLKIHLEAPAVARACLDEALEKLTMLLGEENKLCERHVSRLAPGTAHEKT